jgi:hypothetical protein
MAAVHATTNTTNALAGPKQMQMGQQPNPFIVGTGLYGLSQESNPMEQMGYGMAWALE